jgi:S1-C subfamily serine protease
MISSLLIVLLPLLSGPGTGQQGMVRFAQGDAFLIPELGALVVKDGESLKVQLVPPPGNRADQYRAVDLREGDIVLVVNGKRVKAIADLKKAHELTPVGQVFKLGIQRGQEMMIVAFDKADPKDLPKTKMRIVTSGGEGTEVLPAVGVVLKEKGTHVIIDKLLPVETAALKGLDVKEGDAIIAINGTSVTTVKGFADVYDALAVGNKVQWTTSRSDSTRSISFAKPKPMGRVIIRKEPQ